MYSHRLIYTLAVVLAKLFFIASIVDTGQSRFLSYFSGLWYCQYKVPVSYKGRNWIRTKLRIMNFIFAYSC
jgi:hypothetical protein